MSVEIPETPPFALGEPDLEGAVRPGATYDGTKPFPIILKALFAYLAAERATLEETRTEALALGQSFEDLVGDFASRLAERALQSDLMSLAATVEAKADEGDLQALEAALTAKASPADISAAINALKGSAPAAYDTLQEIAAQLANDESAVSALTTQIAAKYTKPAGGIPASDIDAASVASSSAMKGTYVSGAGGAMSGPLHITGANAGTAGQLLLDDSASNPGVTLGGDTTLFRSGAGQLQTPGLLWVVRSTAGVEGVGVSTSGDTARRFAAYTDGALKFSSGSATADTLLARNSTGGLQLTNLNGTLAAPAAYVLRLTPTQTSSSVSTGGALFISNTANYGSAVNVYSAAVPTITPLSITANAAASVRGANPIASYAFSWGDGTAATGPQATATATHVYAAPGTYTVTVTVTDSLGGVSTQASSVTVVAPTSPTAALALTPTSGAASLLVTANASASTQGTNPIGTYTFAWGDGSSNTGPTTTPTATHAYTTAGAYTVTMTATAIDGTTATATASVTVSVGPAQPTAALTVTPTATNATTLQQTQINSPAFNAVGSQVKYSGTSHAVSISSTSTGSNAQALNVVSTNPNDTTFGVNGSELTRGTIKSVHTGTGNDANASALSLRVNGVGTAAQGIFIDSDTGGTTGNLLTVRNGGYANQHLTLDAAGRLTARGLQVGSGTTPDFGGGIGVLGISAATMAPTTNPAAGNLIVYNDAGTLRVRDSTGAITTLGSGPTEPAGPSPITWADQGLLGWSIDPAIASSSQSLTAGVIALVKIKTSGGTISTIDAYLNVAGATLTAGTCFAALYSTAGTMLGVTADQSTAWVSTGEKSMALTTPATGVAAGFVYAAFLANGTTMPALSCGAKTAAVNKGLSAGSYRFASIGTAQATMPSTLTMGSQVQLSAALVAIVS